MKLRRMSSIVFAFIFIFSVLAFPERRSYAAESMTLPYDMNELAKVGSQKAKAGYTSKHAQPFVLHMLMHDNRRNPRP